MSNNERIKRKLKNLIIIPKSTHSINSRRIKHNL